MILKAGTVISCPYCKADQVKTTKDLLPGSQMKDAGFESMGFDMDKGNAGCYECGTEFVRKHPKTKETQLHTKDEGWISLVKTPDTAKKSIIQTNLH